MNAAERLFMDFSDEIPGLVTMEMRRRKKQQYDEMKAQMEAQQQASAGQYTYQQPPTVILKTAGLVLYKGRFYER